MYRAVTIALASALMILAPSELLARGGGGGGHGGGGGFGGGFGGGHAGFSGVGGGGFGGGFRGGPAGFSGGHMGRMQAGSAGFRAMPGAQFNRHVGAHRFHRKNFFFIGGDNGYYYSCYPVWNGYAWVNYCGYDY
jgi:hypothetical protein